MTGEITAPADYEAVSKRETALHVATRQNHTTIMGLLLRGGAKTNMLNVNGDTPMHIAMAWKHMEAVKVLKEHGSDTTVKNNDGKTPLDMCEPFLSYKCVSLRFAAT